MPNTPKTALTRPDGLQALERAAGQASALDQALAVLMLDLDHFKAFQDGAGDDAAQAVLEQVAALLAARLPAGATLAHLGGDEFFAVLPATDIAAAQALAEQWREAVAAGLAGANAQPPLTATIGVAASPADKHWTGGALLSLADARMTFAKKRLTPHHNLTWAGSLPSDWYTRLDIDPGRWPSL
ncbi:MAG: GGDEF domain-containing protein [Paucibacter sp.]|nr:GGDEF domain-containing protein [Roseateles sp.]